MKNMDGPTFLIGSPSKSQDLPSVITFRRVSWDDPSEVKCQLLVSYGNSLPAVSQDIYTCSISLTELDQMVAEFGVYFRDALWRKSNGKITHTKLTNSGGVD